MNTEDIKAYIDENITDNLNRENKAIVVRNTLKGMVEWLEENYVSSDMGPAAKVVVADLTTQPADFVDVYEIKKEGTYTHFKNASDVALSVTSLELQAGVVQFYKTDNSWHKIVVPVGLASGAVAEGDLRAVSGDEVFNDLQIKGLNNFKITQDPVWIYAVTLNGRVVFGIKRDGNELWWKAGLSPELDALLLTVNNKIDANSVASAENADAIAAIKGITVIEDPIYAFLIKDLSNRIVFGIKKDGSTVGSLSERLNNLIADIDDRFENVTLPENKLILTVGDSLTAAGQYQAEISDQLPGFSVINGGVGGESSRNIVARMGGLRSILTNPVTIPANGTEVQIGDITNSGLQSLDVDGVYYNLPWFRQGLTASNNTINPLTIDGIECTLRWTGSAYNDPAGLYMLKRNVTTADDYTTQANTEVYVSSLKKYRRPRILIAWLGQNVGYVNNDDLVKQYKALVSIVQPEDFVVIGLHSGTAASRADLEKLMAQEFGNRYINWRKYASESALRDMGIAPTEADNTAMAVGSCPPSLLTDAVHLTTAAGRQLGKLIIQTLKNINSWPTIA